MRTPNHTGPSGCKPFIFCSEEHFFKKKIVKIFQRHSDNLTRTVVAEFLSGMVKKFKAKAQRRRQSPRKS